MMRWKRLVSRDIMPMVSLSECASIVEVCLIHSFIHETNRHIEQTKSAEVIVLGIGLLVASDITVIRVLLILEI